MGGNRGAAAEASPGASEVMGLDSDNLLLPFPNLDIPCPECEYKLNGLTVARCPECGNEFDPKELFLDVTEYYYPTRKKLLETFFPPEQYLGIQSTIDKLAQHPQATYLFAFGMLLQKMISGTYGNAAKTSDWEHVLGKLAEAPLGLLMSDHFPRPPREVFRDFPLPAGEARCPDCRKVLPELQHGSCPHCGMRLSGADLVPEDTLGKIPLRKEDTPMLIHMALGAEGIPSMFGSAGHWSDVITGGGGFFAAAGVIRVPQDYYLDSIDYILRHRSEIAEKMDWDSGDLDDSVEEDEWACSSCRESNPSSFDVCWNCDAPKR